MEEKRFASRASSFLLSRPVHTVPLHSETRLGPREIRVLDLGVFALWGPVANHLVSANV